MLRCLTGSVLTLTIFLAGCARPVEHVPVVPVVPEILRTPVTVPERPAETLADVGLILGDHVEALETANARITTTDCILDAAEAGQDPACGE